MPRQETERYLPTPHARVTQVGDAYMMSRVEARRSDAGSRQRYLQNCACSPIGVPCLCEACTKHVKPLLHLRSACSGCRMRSVQHCVSSLHRWRHESRPRLPVTLHVISIHWLGELSHAAVRGRCQRAFDRPNTSHFDNIVSVRLPTRMLTRGTI